MLRSMNVKLVDGLLNPGQTFRWSVLIFCVAIFFTGCATIRSGVGVTANQPSQPRLLRDLLGGDPQGLQIVEKTIDKLSLEKLVAHPEITQVRLVRLVRPASLSIVPEHRLLDISKEGPYTVLGFEPGDVILACHGYVVENPVQFFRYVKALPLFDSGSFDIVRRGSNIRIKVNVIKPVATTAEEVAHAEETVQ